MGVPLMLAGKMHGPTSARTSRARSRRTQRPIQYREVSHGEKMRRCSARCTIYPIDWEEPFDVLRSCGAHRRGRSAVPR
jgi:hypothetical protein